MKYYITYVSYSKYDKRERPHILTVLSEGAGEIVVIGYFADAKTAAQFPLRCEGNLATPAGEGGEPIKFYWVAKVAGGIDLDIDNDSSEGVFGIPARDLEEDRWESADKDADGKALTGKFVPVNDGDADNDQIPGFADFDESGVKDENMKNHFVQATLDVSNTSEMIEWDKARIKFTYSASKPKDEPLDNAPNKKYYMPEDGMIRIWTKDAWEKRNPNPVDADGDLKGDFIPGKKSQAQDGSSGEDNGYEFYANKLFDSTGEMKKTLYIEGIGKGTTSGLIKVEFSPKGDSTWMPDEVKVTTLKLELAKTSKNWMPEGGNDWRDIVPKYTATIQPKGIKGKMKFSLQHVTNYTGYCSNAGDSTEKDLRFKPNQKGFKYNNDGSVETDGEVNSTGIIVQCNDYGAYGELKAETVTVSKIDMKLVANDIQEDGDIYDYVMIPRNEDGDKMADNWEAKQICFELFAPPYFGLDIDNLPSIVEIAKKLTPDFDYDYAYGSTVANIHGDRLGDGLTAFDEYRGFMGMDPKGKTSHVRTNPLVKDLFIRNYPYYHPVPDFGGNDKIQVNQKIVRELGYEIHFIDIGSSFWPKKGEKKVAPYGNSKNSNEYFISIEGDYDKPVKYRFWGKTFPETLPLTPNTTDRIELYMNKLATYTMIYRQNIIDHEIGHACYLEHNPDYHVNESCIMHRYYNVDDDHPEHIVPSTSYEGFCGFCSFKKTTIIIK